MALRIKENIDLKELEKFGFEKNKDINYLKFLVDTEIKIDVITIDQKTRKIERHIKEIYLDEVNCKKVKYIDDLIQAGLVEKV